MVWVTRGDLGVDLFFVISGFLIGSILFSEYKKTKTIRVKRFYLRRFLRLMPVYLVIMLIGILLSKGTPLENWHMAWLNIIYINNYVSNSFMSWTWSLAIEEQFYLLIPFLILFIWPKIRFKFLFFVIIAVLGVGLKYYYLSSLHQFSIPFKSEFPDNDWDYWFWNYYVLTHLRYGGLLVGLCIAYLHVYKSEKVSRFFKSFSRLVNVLIVVSLCVIAMISSLSLGQWTNLETSVFNKLPIELSRFYEAIHRELFYYAVAFIIMACLYSKSVIVKSIKWFLSLKLFYPIAQVSYSAYLFHEMIMYLYFPQAKLWFQNTGFSEVTIMILNSLVSLIVILVLGALVFVYIEQPFNRLKQTMSSTK